MPEISIADITRDLFEMALSGDMTGTVTIIQEVLSLDRFYCVAAPDTTMDDWQRRNYAAYINNKELYLFLDQMNATDFAVINDLMVENTPMVACFPIKAIRAMLQEYRDKGLITSVRIYANLPFYVTCEPDFDALTLPPTVAEPQEQGNQPKLAVSPDSITHAKAILDTAEPAKRVKLDTSDSYRNLHTMIDRLLRDNKISPASVDEALNLPTGMTGRFIMDLKGDSTPEKIVRQYLAIFDLEPYLYQFKGQCAETASELNASQVDEHPIRPAGVRTEERFKLERVRRGKDSNGVYVYQLTLRSPERQITEIVSTPTGYVVGKEYEVTGLDSDVPVSVKDATDVLDAPSEAKLAAVTAKLAAKMPTTYQEPLSEDEEHTEQRKNDIIRYLKRQEGCNSKDAEKKYAALVWEEDILEEFWQYIRTGKGGKIKIHNYTSTILIKELGFRPYEAYCQLVALRKKPQETKQMLKYRKTDPQYKQKKS